MIGASYKPVTTFTTCAPSILNDGDIHAYFSPYDNPYDAFIAFMNVYHDLQYRLNEYKPVQAPALANQAGTV